MFSSVSNTLLKQLGTASLSSLYTNRLVLIGGSGFVGANIALLANKMGIQTLNLDLYQSLMPFNSGIEYCKFDLNVPSEFISINSLLPEKLDLVILATPIIVDSKQKMETQINSQNIFDDLFLDQVNLYYENIHKFITMYSTKIRKIIYVSSLDVYGSLNQLNITIDKTTIPSPNSSYALSKYAGEISVTLSARSVGIQVSILRLSQVFGPGESARYNRLIPKLLKEFSLGRHVELNPFRNCTRQYVSTYQVFAHMLDCMLQTDKDYELRNVVGHKTEFVEIVKMCNEICNFGTFDIKPANDLDWYQANIQIDYPSFLEETFNKGYSEHFRNTLRDELQYMSKELRNWQ